MKSSTARSRAAALARRALAEATEDEDIQVGEELREDVPASRSKASFARALRNISARQKA